MTDNERLLEASELGREVANVVLDGVRAGSDGMPPDEMSAFWQQFFCVMSGAMDASLGFEEADAVHAHTAAAIAAGRELIRNTPEGRTQ